MDRAKARDRSLDRSAVRQDSRVCRDCGCATALSAAPGDREANLFAVSKSASVAPRDGSPPSSYVAARRKDAVEAQSRGRGDLRMAMRKKDVAILGGGLAGSLAAAMLGRAGIDCVLVDPHEIYPDDFRCEKLDGPQVAIL